jgi:hypothetical protein
LMTHGSCRFFLLSHTCHMPRPLHSPWLDLPNCIWRWVQIMKLLIMQQHTKKKHVLHPSIGSTAQIGSWPPPLRFLSHTQSDTHGRTPLDEWSSRRRGLYLHRTQNINTCPELDSNPRSQQPSGRRPTP